MKTVLYKNHGKSVGMWSIEIEDYSQGFAEECWLIISHSKSLEGKKVESRVRVKGKNWGKANETSPPQQAKLELESRVKKQLDKGYVRTLEEASAPATNALSLPQPMLAMPIEKIKNIDFQDAYVQPKYDGHRMLSNGHQLWSRGGKLITTMGHIEKFLKEAGIGELGLVLDGELYIHGEKLWNIGSLVKKQQPGSETVVWNVYDVISDEPYVARYAQLEEIFHSLGRRFDMALAPVRLVKSRPVSDMKNVKAFHVICAMEGFEGAMLRWGKEGYAPGKRVKGLAKVKSFQDAEFKIVGVREGQGRWIHDSQWGSHTATYVRKGIWVLETPEGETFSATIQGDMYENAHLLEEGSKHVGRLLTVKYIYKSPTGIPQLPVALRFYDPI